MNHLHCRHVIHAGVQAHLRQDGHPRGLGLRREGGGGNDLTFVGKKRKKEERQERDGQENVT